MRGAVAAQLKYINLIETKKTGERRARNERDPRPLTKARLVAAALLNVDNEHCSRKDTDDN